MNENNSLVAANDIGPIKINVFGEKYFYNLNRDSFNKISSQALFDAKFSNQLFQPSSLNIIIGTDSGLLPLYLQEKGLPNGTRYIFIEPAPVLEQLIDHQLLEELDPAIVCVAFDEWEEAAKLFKIQDYFYINSVQSFNSLCAEDDNCNVYAELSWHIVEVLAQGHWNFNVALGNESFFVRQLNNLADNLLPAKLLSNAFQGKTVVLLAGGPSLDEALPWVQKHRQQLVIFAVSRISRQLKNIGLEPDFIFSVDPTELSFDISKEMLTFSNRPVFVYSYHTVSSLVNQWQGIGLYLGNRVPWKSPINHTNIGGAGPTVTNTALGVAHKFGFKRIILAGVDLCFTRDGYTHATGSDEHIAGPRFNLTSLQTETNGGFMAPTSCDLVAAINILGLQAEAVTATGCEVINPSANAAKVDNISYIPLADIELDDNQVNVASIVAEQIAAANHLSYNDPTATLNELKRAQFQINAILRLAENALTVNKSMYSVEGIIENYKDKKKLDKIEKKLNRDHRQYSKLVKRFGIRSFIKITKPFTDEDWSAEEAKEMGNAYYEAYRDGAIAILKLIDSAMERIRSRQEEASDNPDFNLLFKQWRKDRSFGRAGLRQKNHPHADIPASAQTEFNELNNLFASVLSNKNTVHMAQAKNHASFFMLKKRASLLFKHQKIQELQDLLSGLHKHEEQTAAPYVYLLNGYLAELQDDIEAAIAAYHHIIDIENSPLLEEALLRIAFISIDANDVDNTNAYLSLQCLSQINPIYLPFYAEIVRLRGDTSAAIDAYDLYISQFPEDALVQMKLTTLYMENKAYAAAGLMLDYILTKTPDSKAAIDLKKQLDYLKTLN